MSSTLSLAKRAPAVPAPPDLQALVAAHLESKVSRTVARGGFEPGILRRLRLTETSIPAVEDEECPSLEARVVCEIEVTGEMVNGAQNLHGGCSAHLIDIVATLAELLHVLLVAQRTGASLDDATQSLGASSARTTTLNVVYHAPAPIGTPIRISATSIDAQQTSLSAKAEIWDEKNKRLVSSGMHVMSVVRSKL